MEIIDKKKDLIIVIAGGDGTMCPIIDELNSKIKDYHRLVFVTMPVGIGNDLSRHLGYGHKISLDYVYQFIERINSPKTRSVNVDSWMFNGESKDKSFKLQKRFIAYFGFGCDAAVSYAFDRFRKTAPFLIKVHVR